eukprot:CAMPEP_0197636568 /NCGR_PEP_ID=MMETSP1338-20131121/12029_1 /TAXON_ID=43686 ORGANISM="Pelagodinium beii, Strain RCC1491" /NCGR_SAMPLE_ID=MMETSP1338 /ASSEMBLY_ACC=CAM_ASM_000754 /LENGTH=370 /DNA_ID=CAMNT_0043208813 /DNA_START=70 /DNA_END=1182 /DNA_ORIENTATION=-
MARVLMDAKSRSTAHINLVPIPGQPAQVQPHLRRTSLTAPVLGDITNTGFAATGGKPADGKAAQPLFAVPMEVSVGSAAPGRLFGRSTFSTAAAPAAPVGDVADLPIENDDVQMEDPQLVSEYIADIFDHLTSSEAHYQPRQGFMDAQKDINAKMRAILVDWLVEVHMKYKLKTETLFMAVNLVDRFLQRRQVARTKLQLCGVTAMLIAAKFEEIYPPEVRDFVYITDNAYSKEDILSMEVNMLTVLDFELCSPSATQFLERYQRVMQCREEHYHLMQYVVELCLPEAKMLKYTPSHLAAAAVMLCNKLMKQHPAWPSSLGQMTSQSESTVKACAQEMCGLLEGAERSQLQAIRRKYSQPKFNSIAKMSF